jgi:hypothetical protein
MLAFSQIGTIGGSVLDTLVLNPILNPTPDIVGRKLTEFGVGGRSEGAGVYQSMGPNFNLPGVLIWNSQVRQIKHVTRTGGKGVGGGGAPEQKTKTFTYEIDLAIAIQEPFTDLFAVNEIAYEGRRIYATTTQIVNEEDWGIEPRVLTTPGREGQPEMTQTICEMLLDVDAWSQALRDAQRIRSGYDATITLAANGANNGTFKVLSDEIVPIDGTDFKRIRLANPNAVSETGSDVRIAQASPTIDPRHVAGVTIFPGSTTQNPSSVIESHLGAGNVPAWRGHAYFVCDSLNLGSHGSIGEFSISVRADDTPFLLTTALTRILEQHGITSDRYDISGVDAAQRIRGYGWNGFKTGSEKLIPLAIAFNLRSREGLDGKVHIWTAGTEAAISIDSQYMAAAQTKAATRRPADFKSVSELLVPTEVHLQYLKDYTIMERGSQSERKIARQTNNVHSIDLPIVLQDKEARAIVSRLLWELQRNSTPIEFQLPPSFLDVQENSEIEFDFEGESFVVTVLSVTEGANYVHRIKGVVTDVSDFEEVEDADSIFDRTIGVPAAVEVHILDFAPLTEKERGVPGFYFAVNNCDPNERWTESTVYTATEADGDPRAVAQVLRNATMGWTTQERSEPTGLEDGSYAPAPADVLGDHPYAALVDRYSVVDVEIQGGTLESVTMDQAKAGRNLCIIGSEVLNFLDATNVEGNVWRLTNFLRARRDTAWACDTHTAVERFILVEEDTLNFVPVNIRDIGSTRWVKALSPGDVVDNVFEQSFELQGQTVIPMAPGGLLVKKVKAGESTADITLNWRRRAPNVFDMFQPFQPIIDYGQDRILEVYNESIYPGVVQRTETLSTDSYVYTFTKFDADGFTGSEDITFKIYSTTSYGERSNPLVFVFSQFDLPSGW